MAITANSSQWTGESDTTGARIVWGEFADEAARDAAIAKLQAEGAKRQQEGASLPDTPLDPPDEDSEGADRRNQRQLGVGTAMAATAMGAAGLVIATGGAMLPAVAAAAAVGAGTGLAGEAVSNVMPDPSSKADARHPVTMSGPVVAIRAADDAAQNRAETLLRELGAVRVIAQQPQ